MISFESWLTVIFPKTCGCCGDSFKEGLSNVLCRPCFDSIQPYEDPVCGHCGIALPAGAFEDAAQFRCRDCGEVPYFLDKVRAFGPYAGALRISHHAFKFEGMESLKGDIAAKMVHAAPADFWEGVAALVPVPLSPERERERGYNPAFLLAQELSLKAGIPLRQLLVKSRSTKPQMSLSRKERFRNPRGAYQRAQGEPALPKVLLVDDVFTTGATLEECAEVLKKGGDGWVGALVFGRTPHHAA